MLVTKFNPTGIDLPVQRFQALVHDALGWDDYKAYGRCYRNKVADGYIAENYEGEGEYKEVYWDDSLSALSFFGLSGSSRVEVGTNFVPVHLVFFVNLKKIAPAIQHRADEEVRKMVQNAVQGGMYGFSLQTVDLWIENVLREYPGSRRDDRLKSVDMHPVHCFRLNFSLQYRINNC